MVGCTCGPTNAPDDYLIWLYANSTPVSFGDLSNLRCDYVFTCVRPFGVLCVCVHRAADVTDLCVVPCLVRVLRVCVNGGPCAVLQSQCHFVPRRYISVTGNNRNTSKPLASVTVPLLEGYTVPTQGHLAFTGAQDEMAITWVTNNSAITPTVRSFFRTLACPVHARTFCNLFCVCMRALCNCFTTGVHSCCGCRWCTA